MLCFCEDATVLREPFYVMSFLQGRIHLDPALPDLRPEQVTLSAENLPRTRLQDSCRTGRLILTAAQRRAMYESLATTLATLHCVKPADVGLAGYGRPSGYSRRQASRCNGCNDTF